MCYMRIQKFFLHHAGDEPVSVQPAPKTAVARLIEGMSQKYASRVRSDPAGEVCRTKEEQSTTDSNYPSIGSPCNASSITTIHFLLCGICLI